MPAALPGSTPVQNLANPSLGAAVAFDPFSGPKGSPLDYDVQNVTTTWPPTYAMLTTKPAVVSGNCSTGAMSTGIGFNPNDKNAVTAALAAGNGITTATLGVALAAQQAGMSGFTDDYIPGTTLPGGTLATLATLLAIGGGKSTANSVAAPSTPAPYLVQPILNAGNGGSRDAGAGPAFTGFGMKVVTAVGAVAIGAAIEAGFLNRSSAAMVAGPSQFGSSNVASNAVT